VRHYQFEAGVSLTGTDRLARPGRAITAGAVALALLQRIAGRAGVGADLPAVDAGIDPRVLTAAADDLWRHRGASLVVSGSQDIETQVVVHALNALLGNVGTTVDVQSPSLQKQGDDEAVARLVDDMCLGNVQALMLYGVNPAYDFPDAARFASGMGSSA
jgi:molybdopterin-containing oxidoreductase family iron-sulfur binding subunit